MGKYQGIRKDNLTFVGLACEALYLTASMRMISLVVNCKEEKRKKKCVEGKMQT